MFWVQVGQIKPIVKINFVYVLLLFSTQPLENLKLQTGLAFLGDSSGPDNSVKVDARFLHFHDGDVVVQENVLVFRKRSLRY